jgi:hypothetical protein
MRRLKLVVGTALAVSALLATECLGRAGPNLGWVNPATAPCSVQFKRCMSRCDRVYESHRAIRACRHRCEDDGFKCEQRPK